MTESFFLSKIKIGNQEYSRFMAAPMDGITDSPFRQIIRDFSPSELLFTEMRHVALVANEKTGIALRYDPIELPLAFQFSANKPDFIEVAVERVIKAGFPSINLNCGCPAKTVIKSSCGSSLMANPELLKTLIQIFIKSINNRVPFTIKLRAGFKTKNAIEIAKMAQDCGVDAIILHPRTQPEGFASRLDYELTKKVKESISVPLIFSGNISNFEIVKKVYELTGCDGFMIGRALWGSPWTIREITDASQGKIFNFTSPRIALQCAEKHLNLNMKFYGSKGFIPFKKQLGQYIRFVPDAAQWRKKLLRSKTESEMRELLNQLIKEQGKG